MVGKVRIVSKRYQGGEKLTHLEWLGSNKIWVGCE